MFFITLLFFKVCDTFCAFLQLYPMFILFYFFFFAFPSATVNKFFSVEHLLETCEVLPPQFFHSSLKTFSFFVGYKIVYTVFMKYVFHWCSSHICIDLNLSTSCTISGYYSTWSFGTEAFGKNKFR